MPVYSCPNSIKKIVTISLFVLSCAYFIFAQALGSVASPAEEEKNLTELQKQARIYRNQGLQFQQIGNLEVAMNLYQKAIELDPSYAVPYNDAGIIYETNGFIDRAEESYLRCVQIDPSYLSAYSNLASLCENKRDLDKAVFYWKKRAELGMPDDPWTRKAKKRLEDINMVLYSERPEEAREQEVLGLMSDVASQKDVLKKDNKQLARSYFDKAKRSYQKGDDLTALKMGIDAKQLDPTNTEIEEFVDKVQIKLLSK